MKAIPGYEGYFAESDGTIWSMRPYKRSKCPRTEAYKMTPVAQGRGYRAVSVRKDGKDVLVKVGKLVLLAFVGERPKGMEVCHGKFGKTIDQLDNLRYGTHASNVEDMKTFDEQLRGSALPQAVLTESQIPAIRGRYASLRQMARDHGVDRATISDILMGRTWRHVE
jgi:hypothetical protein